MEAFYTCIQTTSLNKRGKKRKNARYKLNQRAWYRTLFLRANSLFLPFFTHASLFWKHKQRTSTLERQPNKSLQRAKLRVREERIKSQTKEKVLGNNIPHYKIRKVLPAKWTSRDELNISLKSEYFRYAGLPYHAFWIVEG